MSAIAAKQYTTDLYGQLLDLPENQVGEIIHDQLYVQPRPSWLHGQAEGSIIAGLHTLYRRDGGKTDGWWIIPEPEIHFRRDQEVLVPDIAGWRKARLPTPPKDHRCEVIPDWVCEILSPSTEQKDRTIKMPLYARYHIPFLWLVHPILKTVEVFMLHQEQWQSVGVFSGDTQIVMPPFDTITLDLALWWVD